MLSRVCSAAVNGIEAYPIEVEVNAGYGDTLVVMIVLISPIDFPVRWLRAIAGWGPCLETNGQSEHNFLPHTPLY